MQVYINHDRWIAECPSCRWAAHVQPTDSDFVCGRIPLSDPRRPGANNGGGCGFTAPLDWPENGVEIVNVLAARPDRANRNWTPGESVSDLRAENVRHGYAVAVGAD